MQSLNFAIHSQDKNTGGVYQLSKHDVRSLGYCVTNSLRILSRAKFITFKAYEILKTKIQKTKTNYFASKLYEEHKVLRQ